MDNPIPSHNWECIKLQRDRILNALSRSDGPDMKKVAKEREEAIRIKVAGEKTRKEAERSINASIMSSNPYRLIYGRELTQKEMNQLMKRLNSRQKALKERVERGRRAYARLYSLTILILSRMMM